jgi:hypothetical protein
VNFTSPTSFGLIQVVFAASGTFSASQRHHQSVERFQHLAVETGAGAADIAPRFAVAHGKQERAEIFARAARCGEADNHHLLAKRGLDLEPVAGSLAGVVAARCKLRHHAFFARA